MRIECPENLLCDNELTHTLYGRNHGLTDLRFRGIGEGFSHSPGLFYTWLSQFEVADGDSKLHFIGVIAGEKEIHKAGVIEFLNCKKPNPIL